MEFGIASVAAITVVCYLAGLVLKAVPVDVSRFIPSVCGLAGGGLGLLSWHLQLPDFPAADPITALAVGIVSGLAATGVNQACKQLTRKADEE